MADRSSSLPDLPILQFEEKIAETIEKNPVVVLIGETGSGKSTQLSQILRRRGYTKSGIVGVTQPRRVAAVSVARCRSPSGSIFLDFFSFGARRPRVSASLCSNEESWD